MKQFVSFIRKEFYHIFRDPWTTAILLLMPVILIILFGYAISTEIKRSPIAIWDQRRDEVSTHLIEQLKASEYFELYTMISSEKEAEALFRKGKIKMQLSLQPTLQPTPQPPKGGAIETLSYPPL